MRILDPRKKYVVSGELLSYIFSVAQSIDRHSSDANKRYNIQGEEISSPIVLDDLSISLGKLISFYDNMEFELHKEI